MLETGRTFETINNGNASYLVLKLDPLDEEDTLAVGMLANNKIPGLLPMSRIVENDVQSLHYDISSLTPLVQGYAALGTEKRLMRFLRDYCAIPQNCEEYLLDTDKLMLHENCVYIKATTGELSIPYMAVMGDNFSWAMDVNTFFMTAAHKIAQYLPPESRILPILYKQNFQGKFDPEALLSSLEELEPKSRQRPPEPASAYAFRQQSNSQPLPKPEKVEISRLPESPIPGKRSAPLPENAVPVVMPSPQKAAGGWHWPFGGGKKKPKDEGPSVKAGTKPPNTPMAIDSPFGPPPASPSSSLRYPTPGNSSPMPPFAPQNPSASQPRLTPQPQEKSIMQAAPPYTPQPGVVAAGNHGYTINWNDMDSGVPGGTIRMPDHVDSVGKMQERRPVLWLEHRGDRDSKQVTGNNFHVGRMQGRDEIVDYAVMNSTGYMGADHAYFIVKDNKFYIVDNNSRNGTWLNDNQLQPSVPYEVHNGDVIKMADEVFDLDMR